MRAQDGKQVSEERKEMIVKLVNENPHISVLELAERVGIKSSSNVHYHIRRLMKAGRIQWLGTVKMRGKNLPEHMANRWEKGLVKLRKMSRQEEAERIEMVARKAEGAGKNGEEDPGDDVVRIVRGQLFRNWRITGCKF